MPNEDYIDQIRELLKKKIATKRVLEYVHDAGTANYFNTKIFDYNWAINKLFKQCMNE